MLTKKPHLETEKLNELLTISNFKEVEPYLVENILIVLKRTDDKPAVSEAALNVGKLFVKNFSVQAFPLIIQTLFNEMREESKWKAKVGSLILLGDYIQRLEVYDRELLSACLPELVQSISNLLYDTKSEVSDLAETVLRKAMNGITIKILSHSLKI